MYFHFHILESFSITTYFQNFGWKVFHSKPIVAPGSVHWPKMEAYQRNSKRDFGVGVQHFDHEEMKKCIVTSTPVHGMG